MVLGGEEREDGPAAADAAHGGVDARDQVGGAELRDLRCHGTRYVRHARGRYAYGVPPRAELPCAYAGGWYA